MLTNKTNLTLEEFWALPPGDTAYELVDGKVIPKVSPKYFHSSLQRSFDHLISAWCIRKGRIRAEWAVSLKRNGRDWVPVPDLTYISYERLPKRWRRNEACPVPPELVIEIISPGQNLKDFEDKAKDYFAAGVSRVWVVDPLPEAMSIRAFYPDLMVALYTDTMLIVDELLPGLELTPQLVFEEAELVDESDVL